MSIELPYQRPNKLETHPEKIPSLVLITSDYDLLTGYKGVVAQKCKVQSRRVCRSTEEFFRRKNYGGLYVARGVMQLKNCATVTSKTARQDESIEKQGPNKQETVTTEMIPYLSMKRRRQTLGRSGHLQWRDVHNSLLRDSHHTIAQL